MKTLIDPELKLYVYRCDGLLCNPLPAGVCPQTNTNTKEFRPMTFLNIYEYDDIQRYGWCRIKLRERTIHVCADCTNEVIKKLQIKVIQIISEMVDLNKASKEIANLLFDLDLYEDL